MIRNSVTLYEDDAWDVVSALENLIEMIEEYEPDGRLNREYKDRIANLAKQIEKAIR